MVRKFSLSHNYPQSVQRNLRSTLMLIKRFACKCARNFYLNHEHAIHTYTHTMTLTFPILSLVENWNKWNCVQLVYTLSRLVGNYCIAKLVHSTCIFSENLFFSLIIHSQLAYWWVAKVRKSLRARHNVWVQMAQGKYWLMNCALRSKFEQLYVSISWEK